MAKEIFSQSPAQLALVAIESEGEVFGENEHESINLVTSHLTAEMRQKETRPIVKVMVFCECDHALDKMYQIIHRDMGSHLVCCRKGNGCVCAQIYAMKDFEVRDCMSIYYTHLYRSSCHKTEIWVSSEGGTR